jgi:hypothetical protein
MLGERGRRLFPTFTRRRLQRGVFNSLVDLQAAINRCFGERNRKPKPFIWTADPDRIIEKVNRGYPVMASDHYQLLSKVANKPSQGPSRLGRIRQIIFKILPLNFQNDKLTYSRGIKRPIFSTTFALNSSGAIRWNLACDDRTSRPLLTTTACR